MGQDEAGEAGRGQTPKCLEVLVKDFCRDSNSNGKPWRCLTRGITYSDLCF